jgi:hypothetical protein
MSSRVDALLLRGVRLKEPADHDRKVACGDRAQPSNLGCGAVAVCFSAEADLVAGAVVGGIGIDALRHIRRPADRLLAAVPIVLAVHQLIEALVWLGLEGHVGDALWRTALYLYLGIAFGVMPVLMPAAIGALEHVASRWRSIVFTALGGVVAVTLMYSVVRGPVRARIEGHHIAYSVDLWHGGLIVALYVLATCGLFPFSQHRYVQWFGAANLLGVAFLVWLDKNGLISLWCAWAAVTSVAIAVHLRHGDQTPRPVTNAVTVPRSV